MDLNACKHITDEAKLISTYQASLSVSAILTMLSLSVFIILTNADDAKHISTYQASLSVSAILTMLSMSVFIIQKGLRPDFCCPPLRVPSLEYAPDIHLSGSASHLRLST